MASPIPNPFDNLPAIITALERAKNSIEDPKNWVSDRAKTPEGAMCATQALMEVILPQSHASRYLHRAANKLGYQHAVKLNSGSDHETVMKMYDLAIELAKGEYELERNERTATT